MLQFPIPYPPGTEVPPPSQFDQMCGFAVLYLFVLTLLSFLLPRRCFVALFKIAFPFMPEKLQEKDHD
jgi:hypothetical protein